MVTAHLADRQAFHGDVRVMVRSSANCEDLQKISGAGLYDSIANVPVQNQAAVRKLRELLCPCVQCVACVALILVRGRRDPRGIPCDVLVV